MNIIIEDRHGQPAIFSAALSAVKKSLDEKLTTGCYSFGLLIELAGMHVSQGPEIYPVLEEIGKLERVDPRPSGTKAAAIFKREPLVGLWHKHYFQPENIILNILGEAQETSFVTSLLAELESQMFTAELAKALSFKLVHGAIDRRLGSQRATGHWIVFEKIEESNYYICLGVHGSKQQYRALRERIDKNRLIDQVLSRCEATTTF